MREYTAAGFKDSKNGWPYKICTRNLSAPINSPPTDAAIAPTATFRAKYRITDILTIGDGPFYLSWLSVSVESGGDMQRAPHKKVICLGPSGD